MRIKNIIGGLLLLTGSMLAAAPAEISAETFLKMTRDRASLQNSFADLRGDVTHLRRNMGGAKRYPIRFVILFDRSEVKAKLFINENEKHTFYRNMRRRGSAVSNVNVREPSLLSQLGFQIGDLTMDFLDNEVYKEFPSDTLKTLACRVLALRGTDGKVVKVWVARDYLFPLRAEFFSSVESLSGKPDRTLEITGFKKVNDYYVATDIALFCSEFRSRIAFADCKATSSNSTEAVTEFASK